nr:Ycf66 family protein [Petrachloros mirabilis]
MGIVLIICAVALFFIDRLKPGYERDSDKIYAILLLISALVLLTHWNMELTLSFQQMIMAGMLATLLIENIRNRVPRGNVRSPESVPPARPEDYRPSRSRAAYDEPMRANVHAALEDDYLAEDQFARARRIRGEGRGEPRPTYRQESYRQDTYLEDIPEEPQPSRRSRRPPSPLPYEEEAYSKPPSRRRSPLQLQGDEVDSRSSSSDLGYASTSYSESSYGKSASSEMGSTKQRRRNGSSAFDLISSDPGFSDPGADLSSTESRRRRTRKSYTDGEYVDYEPLDTPQYPDQYPSSVTNGASELDNSSHFDDDPNLL